MPGGRSWQDTVGKAYIRSASGDRRSRVVLAKHLISQA